jgi:hypothetical protein
MTTGEGCPRCGSSQVDEYTHYECPPGSTTENHRPPWSAPTPPATTSGWSRCPNEALTLSEPAWV